MKNTNEQRLGVALYRLVRWVLLFLAISTVSGLHHLYFQIPHRNNIQAGVDGVVLYLVAISMSWAMKKLTAPNIADEGRR